MKKVVVTTVVILGSLIVLIGIAYGVGYHRSLVVDTGPGMEPTIQSNQEVRMHPYSHGQTPQRRDVIEFTQKTAGNKTSKLIERIIALPSERIVIANGQVTVFNNQHKQGFNPDNFLGNNVTTPGNIDLTLAPNTYFVMGDNRSDSLDSRIFGPVPLSAIIGKISY